jgi:hypothetical protein
MDFRLEVEKFPVKRVVVSNVDNDGFVIIVFDDGFVLVSERFCEKRE